MRGEARLPDDLTIRFSQHTLLYGYAVCDLTAKVKRWLHGNLTEMPHEIGWFHGTQRKALHSAPKLADAKMTN